MTWVHSCLSKAAPRRGRWRTFILVWVLGAGGGLLGGSATGWSAPEYAHVLHALSHDPAYKVRMKAVDVVVRRVRQSHRPASDAIIAALGRAATDDAHRLVRGSACAGLGRLADARARTALQRALADREPFVRAQAEDALSRLGAARRDPTERRRVVLTVRVSKGLQPEIEEHARLFLLEAFRARAVGWTVGGAGAGTGVRIRAMARAHREPSGAGHRISVEVRLSVSTWPDNALKHVLSARAAAVDHRPQPSIHLYDRLLKAASERAVADAWARIQQEGT